MVLFTRYKVMYSLLSEVNPSPSKAAQLPSARTELPCKHQGTWMMSRSSE